MSRKSSANRRRGCGETSDVPVVGLRWHPATTPTTISTTMNAFHASPWFPSYIFSSFLFHNNCITYIVLDYFLSSTHLRPLHACIGYFQPFMNFTTLPARAALCQCFSSSTGIRWLKLGFSFSIIISTIDNAIAFGFRAVVYFVY